MSRSPLSTIVVGTDGLSGGDDAAALARTLAGAGTTVALVHVTPEESELGRARAVLHAARERFGGPCLTLLRTAVDTATGLRDAARDLHADLLVVGTPSPRPTGAPPADLSSILHHAPCAVGVAPRGEAERERTLRRIGVAYRDTPSGHAALTLGRELAATCRAEVDAMTVVPLLPRPWLGPTLGGAEAAHRLGGEPSELARTHLATLPDVTGLVTEGDPAAQLTRFSRTVDLLIVGTRGHGALRRLLVGSTAEVLLTASACPVLVVPGGAVGAPDHGTTGAAEPAGLTTR